MKKLARKNIQGMQMPVSAYVPEEYTAALDLPVNRFYAPIVQMISPEIATAPPGRTKKSMQRPRRGGTPGSRNRLLFSNCL
jgi:hypothetical protein